MMTDVKGIRDAKGRHLSTVSRKDVQRMVKKGTISEGMLPKVHACLDALAGGVGKAHIIDGRIPHAILLEVFTHKGIGTEIVACRCGTIWPLLCHQLIFDLEGISNLSWASAIPSGARARSRRRRAILPRSFRSWNGRFPSSRLTR